MRLDVESLRTFRTVVECGGMTRAAARLNLTQSAVSWKVRRLEERLGRPLVSRDGRNLRLTEDGETLLAHAARIVDAHDAAVACFRSDPLSGELRIGMTEDIAVGGVAVLVARFGVSHPRLRISVRMEQSTKLARWLGAGEIDAALLQVCETDVGEDDLVLERDELSWVAAQPGLADERPMPLVTFGPSCFYRPLMLAALERAGRDGRIVVQAPSMAAVGAALAAGLGVGVGRRKAVGRSSVRRIELPGAELPRVAQVLRTCRSLKPDVARRLEAVLLERAALSPAAA